MLPTVLEGFIAVALLLIAASGIWVWFALRDPPPSPREVPRGPPPRPVPPPSIDLVGAQEAWRRENDPPRRARSAPLLNESPIGPERRVARSPLSAGAPPPRPQAGAAGNAPGPDGEPVA